MGARIPSAVRCRSFQIERLLLRRRSESTLFARGVLQKHALSSCKRVCPVLSLAQKLQTCGSACIHYSFLCSRQLLGRLVPQATRSFACFVHVPTPCLGSEHTRPVARCCA